LNFKRGILGRYFNHFSGRFLFFEGDYQNPGQSIPNSGMMLFTDLIFVVFGTFYLLKTNNRLAKFVFFWLVLSPLPAVLTRDQVQSVRAFNMVIPLVIISSAGAYFVITYLRRINNSFLQSTCCFLIATLFSLSFIYFLDSYFVHLPIHNAKYWNYGYKDVVETITPIQGNYKRIIFQQSYSQPYIYFLFYQKYDPHKYQTEAKLSESPYGDVGLVEDLDNIHFQGFSWPYATGEQGTLLVGNSVAIPPEYSQKEYKLIREIKYPDKFTTAFRIVEVK
jgi:hypothetical protein